MSSADFLRALGDQQSSLGLDVFSLAARPDLETKGVRAITPQRPRERRAGNVLAELPATYPGLDGEPMEAIYIPEIDFRQVVADARRARSRALANIVCALLEWRMPTMSDIDGRP